MRQDILLNGGFHRQERGRESMLNGYSVSIGEDKKVLEMDVGHSCRTMRIYLMPQNCGLKND